MGKSQGGSGSAAKVITDLWIGGPEIAARRYLAAMQTESDRIFGGSDFWVLRESVGGGGFHGAFAFSTGTRAFIGLGQGGNTAEVNFPHNEITEYVASSETALGTFTDRLTIPFGTVGRNSCRAAYFAANDKGYIFTGHRILGAGFEFFVYNVATAALDSGQALPPFGGRSFHMFSVFSIQDKIFMFGGFDYSSTHGLHIYVPATNVWDTITSRIAGAPTISIPPTGFRPAFDPLGDFNAGSTFVINDIAYIQYANKFMQVTAQTEAAGGVITFTQLPNLPVSRYFASMVGRVNPLNPLDHEIYVIAGSPSVPTNPLSTSTVYKYSTATAVWVQQTDFTAATPSFTMGVGFVLNGRLFAGLGSSGGSLTNYPTLIEYKPKTESTPSLIPRTYARRDFDEVTGLPRTNDELNGLNALATRAKTESPLVTAANAMFVNTFTFTANPKMDSTFATRVAQIVRDFKRGSIQQVNRNSQSVGRFGGASHYAILSKYGEKIMAAITEAAKTFYMDDYDREMAIGMASNSLGLAYSNVAIKNAESLFRIGQLKREYEQGRLDDHYKRYHDAIQRQSTGIEILGNAVRVFMGSHVTTTTPYYIPGKMSEIAGLALVGLSLIPSSSNGKAINADAVDVTRPKRLEIPSAPRLAEGATL
jgi:hypothetical protein